MTPVTEESSRFLPNPEARREGDACSPPAGRGEDLLGALGARPQSVDALGRLLKGQVQRRVVDPRDLAMDIALLQRPGQLLA